MSENIPRAFYKMPAVIMFFLTLPLFYFMFVLIWRPFDMEELLAVGKDRYTLNLIVTTLILLGTGTISRMLLFLLRNKLDLSWAAYIIWCIGETAFAGLMFSIPIGIGWGGVKPYFSVMLQCLLQLGGIVIYPYLILSMAVHIKELARRGTAPATDEKTLIRFFDEQKRLKLIVSSENVFYIEADENYVHIVHLDGVKVKDFQLRSSMHALEDILSRHSLVRCHRSFFVNPAHVELVRKDESGYAIARLDREGLKPVPVSKRYYSAITALL